MMATNLRMGSSCRADLGQGRRGSVRTQRYKPISREDAVCDQVELQVSPREASTRGGGTLQIKEESVVLRARGRWKERACSGERKHGAQGPAQSPRSTCERVALPGLRQKAERCSVIRPLDIHGTVTICKP